MPTKVYEQGERKRPKDATVERIRELHDDDHFSFAQIGRLCNISKQRVKQLYDKASSNKIAGANGKPPQAP